MRYPIDIVYTWVDGKDPKHASERARYLGENEDRNFWQFVQNDELRYSIRSLEMYAPFFRSVFVVVANGQKPGWINFDHPDLHLIDHETIFLDKEDLPTFCSNAIESNLHNIPGLSEHFIYFNDDTFLGNKITESEIVTPKGKLVLHLCPHDFTTLRQPQNKHQVALQNSHKLIRSRYSLEPLDMPHVAMPMMRSSHQALWSDKVTGPIMRTLSATRFETMEDYLPPELNLHNTFYRGKGVLKRSIDHYFGQLRNDSDHELMYNHILTNKPQFFCINDNMSMPAPDLRERFRCFLEECFPIPSRFELIQVKK